MKESEYEIYFTLCSGAVFRKLLKLQDIIFRFMPDGAFGEMGGQKTDFISLCRSMAELVLMQDSGHEVNRDAPVILGKEIKRFWERLQS